ncbi:ESAT-6 protein secretion system EspG family protein [Prauserella shujinwangii]|uniref:ESAT-6 protein secretion system EspG family protein n=1 Tax=Prauserella shujinwangii TaxID=1453103 RepID=A0A2T0M336_9PSEU|nr:ESX secretion-associated protein EspG [Prauserella shujinwangii]PRX51136.1 ESAT-6 protein secretion system EspG family protein [Prauserella shujinwangii]
MIRLSASAFDILWADLGHARPPAPLRVRSVGRTESERAEIRAAVYDNLAERGLYAGGELDPGLRDRLDTLAAASFLVECEALLDLAEPEPLRAVAAATGSGDGVLAVQPRQTIGLSAIRDAEVYVAAVSVLPDLHAGPGFGVSLPVSALGGALRDPVFDEASGSGPFDRQIREVLAIQARPVLAAGQFSVRAARGRLGGLSWFATDVGAYLGTVEPGRGGEDWMTVAPVDSDRLVARLADLAGA